MVTQEELNEEIRKREICFEVLRKLLFIKELYKGATVPQAAKEVGMSKVAGHIWFERSSPTRKTAEGLRARKRGLKPWKSLRK